MAPGQTAPAPRTGLALFVLLPVAAHLLFSGLGFAPTDQGFILAGARRILDGEIPHRDFITVRPAGSLLLHAPVVWLGGSMALWLSRAIAWLELAGTAWIWTALLFGRNARPALRIALAAIAAMLSAHTFPIMAWHTIDALFLASAGIALAIDPRGGSGRRSLGWLLLGITPLCRQNFVVVPPAALVLLGQARRPDAWGFTALPGLAYVGFLLAAGGLDEAFVQLRTHGAGQVWQAGFVRSATLPGTWVGLGAGLGAAAVLRRAGVTSSSSARALGSAIALGTVGLAAAGLVPGAKPFPWFGALVLFGAAGALVAGRAVAEGASPFVRHGLLACFVAWTVSLSIGYNTPALAAGPLALVILASVPAGGAFVVPGRGAGVLAPTVLLAFAVAVAFAIGRSEEIYRERPARELTFDVGSRLAAGRFLWTNPRTGLFLEELDRVASDGRARGKRLVILPDFAAWWVVSPHPNPLPVDWTLDVELARPELVARTVAALRRERGRVVVAVQKFETHSAPAGFAPLSETRYEVVNLVRREFTKTGETLLFEVYE